MAGAVTGAGLAYTVYTMLELPTKPEQVMVVVPGESAVATPVDGSIVATAGLLLVHIPPDGPELELSMNAAVTPVQPVDGPMIVAYDENNAAMAESVSKSFFFMRFLN